MITSAFFSRIEPGKTHAFAAQKIETAPKDIAVSLPYWVFLDPLCGHPLIVGDSTVSLLLHCSLFPPLFFFFLTKLD